MSDVEIKDNSKQAIAEMKAAMLTGLEACGMQAETYAKQETPVDTGRLKNSITHKVVTSEPACYIGTNVEYALWQEIGTGIYASEGGGRTTPWFYTDEKTGETRMTRGSKPHHMLKKAVGDHADEYKKIMKQAGGK